MDMVTLRLQARWSAAEVFERAGRSDEAKALLQESVELAERYGHVVAAQPASARFGRDFLAAQAGTGAAAAGANAASSICSSRSRGPVTFTPCQRRSTKTQ